MKENNYHIKKRMSPIETALIGNLIYIVLVLILKSALDLIRNNGNYGITFGAIELGVTAVYWIGLNWFLFRNPANKHTQNNYGRYILFSLLPVLVFTFITSIVIYTTPGTNFISAWNQFAFLVAPTLFWYLPFSLVYHFVGTYVPIIVYFGICLLLLVLFQVIGIALGAGRRRALKERVEKRIEQRSQLENIAAKKAEAVSSAKRRKESVAAEAAPSKVRKKQEQPRPKPKKVNTKDPFDEGEQTQIIYTEAFSAITDEMLEEVNKASNIKKVEIPMAEKEVNPVVPKTSDNLMDAIDIEGVSGAIKETQKNLKETQMNGVKEKVEPLKSNGFLDKEKSETMDISEELQSIRKRMSQDSQKRRK